MLYRCSVRVKPMIDGKFSRGSEDAQPYMHLLGGRVVGHREQILILEEGAKIELEATGVFDVKVDWTSPEPRSKHFVTKLVGRDRDDISKIVKLHDQDPSDPPRGAA